MGALFTPYSDGRRLSKPRTNASSIMLTSSDPEADITSPPKLPDQQDYFGDYAAVVSSQGERRSRRKSRSRIRAYLYGSNNETIEPPSDDEDGQNGFVGAARDMKKRLSRTSSSIMQLQSAKPSTARLSDASSTRLQLTGSQSSDAEESAMIADQIKERAYQDCIAAQNHVAPPINEDKHVDSVLAPVRRKSLYTPGLATRNPSDILRKPPQPATIEPHIDRDYYYDPSKPKESPLSQLAALHLAEDGRSTPSNINYPQLGGLQLGTLRVTNDITSPEPRDRTPDLFCHTPTPESRAQDDHYTACEESVIGAYSFAIPHRGASPLVFEGKPKTSSPLDPQCNTKPGAPFPSQYSDPAASMAYEYMSELDASPFRQAKALDCEVESAPVEDEAILISQAESPAAEMWKRFSDDPEVRHGARDTQEDAFRKLNGASSSTSESNRPRRPSMPCSMSSRYSGRVEVLHVDSGYASKASLNTSQTVAQSNALDPRPSVNSQKADQMMEQSSPARLQPPEVIEKRSTRSISGPREMPQPQFERGRYSLQEAGPPPLPYSFSVMSQTTLQVKEGLSNRASSQNFAKKLRKRRPKSQPPSPVVSGRGCREFAEARIPRVPSIIAVKHAERLRQFPLLDHTFPSSQHTNIDDHDSLSEPNNSVYPLPIRFPSPANALEAAVAGDPESSMPGGGGRSRSRVSSKYRHSTVVQVQDEEWPDSSIVRSPSWSDFGRDKRSKEQRRLAKQEKADEKRLAKEEKELEKRLERARKQFEKQSKSDEGKHRFSRSRSASRTRAKSCDRTNQQKATAIADFGTVAQSLGGSPYDIATSLSPLASCDGSNCHPHQISTATPRPKSIFGSHEVVGVEAARNGSRSRSQTFGRPTLLVDEILGKCSINGNNVRPQTMFVDVPPMPAIAAVDLKFHALALPKSQPKSRSLNDARGETADSSYDQGVLSGQSQSHNEYTDTPPVPALPSAQQVMQREAQLERSRPQSMIIDASPVHSLPGSENGRVVEVVQDGSPTRRSETLTRPRKPRAKTTVPDLWSNGSLERKGPRHEDPTTAQTSDDPTPSDQNPAANEDNMWEAQRQAWRQRRQSAGEALLKNRVGNISDDRLAPSDSPSQRDQRCSSPVAASSRPKNTDHEVTARPNPRRPGPNPLGMHPTFPSPNPPPAQSPSVSPHRASTFALPRKNIGSGGTSTPPRGGGGGIERLTGRYDGGLLYGYEPGCGLGGSAGTRGAKTGASRKSVEVSRGFGLDLSDVPIFVVPTTTAGAR